MTGFNIFDDIVAAPLKAIGLSPNELPIVGGLFGNPEEEALQRQMMDNAARLRQMGPQMADARMQGLRQQLGALGPANSMLAAMYGPGAAVDMAALGQSPVPPGLFSQQPPPPMAPPSQVFQGQPLIAPSSAGGRFF